MVYFLFLRVLRCFSSPGSPPCTMCSYIGYLYVNTGAFPHSDTCGSMSICNSPQLFAAYHVLLRRLMPGHPPYALYSLNLFSSIILLLQDKLSLFTCFAYTLRVFSSILVFLIICFTLCSCQGPAFPRLSVGLLYTAQTLGSAAQYSFVTVIPTPERA